MNPKEGELFMKLVDERSKLMAALDQAEIIIAKQRKAIALAIARGLSITIGEVTDLEIDKMITDANLSIKPRNQQMKNLTNQEGKS